MMSAAIETKNLNLWYGDHQALHRRQSGNPRPADHRPHRTLRLRKSTFLKTLNRMNDLVPGVRIEGEVNYDGRNLYAPDVDVTGSARRSAWSSRRQIPSP
jgi:phosphate transport system ATP-binding protein